MRIVVIHYMHAMRIATQSANSDFVSVEVSRCAPDIGLLSLISLQQTNKQNKQKKKTPVRRSHQVCFCYASFNSYAALVPYVLVWGLLVHTWAGTYAASCFNAVLEPALCMLMP